MVATSNPLQRGSQGWGIFLHQNHAARWENGSSWWGCLCDLCFASKKSSEREFFVPAGTHLGGKLLINICEWPICLVADVVFMSAGKWDLVVVPCPSSAACRDISARIVGDMDISLFCLFFDTWLHHGRVVDGCQTIAFLHNWCYSCMNSVCVLTCLPAREGHFQY